jgi:hypothetical protein
MPSPPILFITFSRFEITRKVFEQIRRAQPERLYLVSDGPRPQNRDEAEKVQQIRDYLSTHIDWECNVKELFRETNRGCDRNIMEAIHWFFENEKAGIILEDDCLPHLSFFRFCDELLDRYADNQQVFMISGDNFAPSRKQETNSYRCTTLSYSWGWATWRDRWEKIKTVTEARSEINSKLVPDFLKGTPQTFWNERIHEVRKGTSTWDVDWQFALWTHRGVSIFPTDNLIKNIGVTGTHMKPYDPTINLSAKAMSFPLRHPDGLQTSEKRDFQVEKLVRRSALKNIELVLKYVLSLLFKNNEPFLSGIRKLFCSLINEAKSRNSG